MSDTPPSSASPRPDDAVRTRIAAPPPPAGAPAPPSPPLRRERRRRNVGWQSRDILRAAALVLGLYLLLQLLWVANPLVLTAFLGVLFGLGVEAGVDRLQRYRIPRGLAATLIVLTFLGLLVGFGWWTAPTLRAQAGELRDRLPQAIERIEGWLGSRRGGMLGTLLGGPAGPDRPQAPADTVGGRGGAGGAADTVGGTEPREAAPAEADVLDTAAAQPARTMGRRLSGQFSQLSRYLFPFLSSTLAAISGVLLILFITIYIAADPDIYHRGLMHLFPHHIRARAGEVLSATATVLRRWLVTQLIGMVVIGVVTTAVLWMMDVRAALALGVLAGLLEFIPTFGPIISAVPAIAMGFLDSPEKALWVAVAYIVIQLLESNLLIPMLMKEGLDLPPALTILSQALMALVFGFLGLLVAVPLFAAILVPIKMLYVEDVVGDDVAVPGEEEDD